MGLVDFLLRRGTDGENSQRAKPKFKAPEWYLAIKDNPHYFGTDSKHFREAYDFLTSQEQRIRPILVPFPEDSEEICCNNRLTTMTTRPDLLVLGSKADFSYKDKPFFSNLWELVCPDMNQIAGYPYGFLSIDEYPFSGGGFDSEGRYWAKITVQGELSSCVDSLSSRIARDLFPRESLFRCDGLNLTFFVDSSERLRKIYEDYAAFEKSLSEARESVSEIGALRDVINSEGFLNLMLRGYLSEANYQRISSFQELMNDDEIGKFSEGRFRAVAEELFGEYRKKYWMPEKNEIEIYSSR